MSRPNSRGTSHLRPSGPVEVGAQSNRAHRIRAPVAGRCFSATPPMPPTLDEGPSTPAASTPSPWPSSTDRRRGRTLFDGLVAGGVAQPRAKQPSFPLEQRLEQIFRRATLHLGAWEVSSFRWPHRRLRRSPASGRPIPWRGLRAMDDSRFELPRWPTTNRSWRRGSREGTAFPFCPLQPPPQGFLKQQCFGEGSGPFSRAETCPFPQWWARSWQKRGRGNFFFPAHPQRASCLKIFG